MWLLILLLIGLDQITKYMFGFVFNTGGAFGILKGFNVFFVIINIIILGVCVYYYRLKKYRIAILFLISGIAGNLIDRIYFGHVRDFIDVGFFPVFNMADSLNVIGITMLIILLWRK
ncbi:signal peptidase II [Candidatus Woesearchaeota archaeon]|nr:signal peptidase II [Candidatus Woesearchaeota archaeon]